MATIPLKTITFPGLDNTYTVPQLDNTLTMAGKAADAKATGDEITLVKQDISASIGYDHFPSSFAQTSGLINDSGQWTETSGNAYKHIAIPVTPGSVVSIVGNISNNTWIGFLRSYSLPLSGSADFSTATDFTSRKQLTKGASYSYIIPSDTNFIYILVLNNLNDTTPSNVTINNINISKSLFYNVEQFDSRLSSLESDVSETDSLYTSVGYQKFSTYPETKGSIKATGVWGNISNTYKHVAIPVKSSDLIQIIGNTVNNTWIAFLKTYSSPVEDGGTVNFSDATGFTDRIQLSKGGHYTYVVPSDTHYLIVHTIMSTDCTPVDLSVNYISLFQTLKENLERTLSPKNVKWCVMGDSIPNGYHSEIGEEGEEGDRYKTWAYLVSQYNNWNIDNIAIGGSGYLLTRNGEAGYTLARSVDFTKYNLVTIAYGINDWKGNQVMGDIADSPVGTPTTVIGAMKATIEGILASNPYIKIIVITPLNCRGYDLNYGTEETNYALGYEFSNSGTLQSFVEALISVCNYYGIQYIDMTHYSVINRKNLPTMLPDGVHPSYACHAQLAGELSKKITY